MDQSIELVIKTLKDIKRHESEIKKLKESKRADQDAIIRYMKDEKKRFLGELELKVYKGTYYLSISDELF